MNYSIKYILSLIAVVYSTCVYSQTNLICNPSFEDVDQEALNRLNDGQEWYSTHFYSWGDDYPNYPSLFNCWERDIDHALIAPGLPVGGVSYGITPGLFPATDGSTHNYYANYPNTPFTEEDSDGNLRIFRDEDTISGLTLAANSNGLHGLDLSPPNTKFGENVYATHGNSYAALFDFENKAWSCVPSLFTELKYPLQKDVEYTFSMDFCKMNLLGYLKDTEGWDEVKDGKIEVYISYDEAPLSPRQKICEIEAGDNAWDITTWNFVAERSYTHLLIEFDPIKGGVFVVRTKIAGVFIDNLKLFEACETPENQCENANYKRDLLDARLEQVQMHSPMAYPDDEGFNEGEFKTVRAYHLENVKRFEIKIYPHNSSTACYELDMWYPPSDWFWDGKNYNGDPMPEGHYDAIINAVSNDCFHITNADQITVDGFPLKYNYSVFNVSTSTNIEDGNGFINGLENVSWMNVRLYTVGGSLVHEFNLNNPPSSIGLSIPSLETYGGVQNGEIAPASYRVVVTVSNNCSEMTYDYSSVNIGGLPDSGSPSPYYNWSPVSKPVTFACPFNFHYDQYVRSPMNCCEGYLHLHDMEVWNSWGEINIQDSILLGPNLVFEPGTYNYLNSEQIVFLPDETGTVVLGEGIFTPGTFNCQICKSYTFESVPTFAEDENDREIVYANQEMTPERSKEMILYPNPAKGDQEITLLAGTTAIDPQNYKLVLSDPLGKPIQVKMIAERRELLKFKPVNSLSPGSYYLYYESNGEVKTFSLVIR